MEYCCCCCCCCFDEWYKWNAYTMNEAIGLRFYGLWKSALQIRALVDTHFFFCFWFHCWPPFRHCFVLSIFTTETEGKNYQNAEPKRNLGSISILNSICARVKHRLIVLITVALCCCCFCFRFRSSFGSKWPNEQYSWFKLHVSLSLASHFFRFFFVVVVVVIVVFSFNSLQNTHTRTHIEQSHRYTRRASWTEKKMSSNTGQ